MPGPLEPRGQIVSCANELPHWKLEQGIYFILEVALDLAPALRAGLSVLAISHNGIRLFANRVKLGNDIRWQFQPSGIEILAQMLCRGCARDQENVCRALQKPANPHLHRSAVPRYIYPI